jgi:hypothetical protein
MIRTPGQSDLVVTLIGVGAWAIGGGKWDAKARGFSIPQIRSGISRKAFGSGSAVSCSHFC